MNRSEGDLISYRMRILSFFAISFVVLGHINFFAYGRIETTFTEAGTFWGWFPYYSFHLPLFLFISGFYFRDLQDGKPFLRSLLKFLLKKARNFLLPYYIVSGLSLLINTALFSRGFTFGTRFSFSDWLFGPFTKLYLVTFSTPSWYLIALFVAELYFLLLRKALLSLIRKETIREVFLLFFTLFLGIAAVYIHETTGCPETVSVYLRSVVMLFFLQVGVLYRKYREKVDLLPGGWYFLFVFAAQFLLILLSGNQKLSPGLYALSDFGKTGFVFFFGGLTGIMLWLRISTLLAQIPKRSKVLAFIGENTKYIMFFHVFSWFLLNSLFQFLISSHAGGKLLANFNSGWYHSFLYYADTSNPRMTLFYYLAGMALPLLPALLIRFLKRKLPALKRRQEG